MFESFWHIIFLSVIIVYQHFSFSWRVKKWHLSLKEYGFHIVCNINRNKIIEAVGKTEHGACEDPGQPAGGEDSCIVQSSRPSRAYLDQTAPEGASRISKLGVESCCASALVDLADLDLCLNTPKPAPFVSLESARGQPGTTRPAQTTATVFQPECSTPVRGL